MEDVLKITNMTSDNWEEVARIYAEGIATNMATFEKEIPSWETWSKNHLLFGRLLAEIQSEIVGWAALSPVSSRCVYGGVAEVSVYVSANSRGKNIGFLLLDILIHESEKNGIWTLQSGVFPENKASIQIHQKAGFRQIGYRERIGQLDGVWKDNLIFERRSKIVGIH